LADGVSSIAGLQGRLTEAEAATYWVGSFINKQSFGAFFDQKEKGKCNPGE